VTITLINSKH